MLSPPPLTGMYSWCPLPAYWIAVTRTPSPWHKTTLCSLCICSFLPQQHCLSRAFSSAGRYFCITPFSVTKVVQIYPIQYIVLYCHYAIKITKYREYLKTLQFFPSSWELHWSGESTQMYIFNSFFPALWRVIHEITPRCQDLEAVH